MSEVTSTNALVKDSTVQTLNSKLDTLNTTLGGNTNIAPVFNTATAYTKGDMVYYNNDLYVFTSNHSAGAWTGNDVVQTKVSTEISSLKSGLTNEITIRDGFISGKVKVFGIDNKQYLHIDIANSALRYGTLFVMNGGVIGTYSFGGTASKVSGPYEITQNDSVFTVDFGSPYAHYLAILAGGIAESGVISAS